MKPKVWSKESRNSNRINSSFLFFGGAKLNLGYVVRQIMLLQNRTKPKVHTAKVLIGSCIDIFISIFEVIKIGNKSIYVANS
jgi:hypothetical protein